MSEIRRGSRVRVERASGDRKWFQECTGEVKRVQGRLRKGASPFVHVLLDDFTKTRVFWPHELVAIDDVRGRNDESER